MFGQRSKPSYCNTWGHTGMVTQNTLHSVTHWSRDRQWSHGHNSQGNTQARSLSPPTLYVVTGTQTHQPQQNETLTHTHTHVWPHANTTHTDTPRDSKPHTQTRPVTNTQPVLVPYPVEHTRFPCGARHGGRVIGTHPGASRYHARVPSEKTLPLGALGAAAGPPLPPATLRHRSAPSPPSPPQRHLPQSPPLWKPLSLS